LIKYSFEITKCFSPASEIADASDMAKAGAMTSFPMSVDASDNTRNNYKLFCILS
jgi:hypothetical protein